MKYFTRQFKNVSNWELFRWADLVQSGLHEEFLVYFLTSLHTDYEGTTGKGAVVVGDVIIQLCFMGSQFSASH